MHGVVPDGPASGVNSEASPAELPASCVDWEVAVAGEDWVLVVVLDCVVPDCAVAWALAAGGARKAEMTPSMGEATYSAESSALASRSSDPKKMFAPVHGEPGRGVLL